MKNLMRLTQLKEYNEKKINLNEVNKKIKIIEDFAKKQDMIWMKQYWRTVYNNKFDEIFKKFLKKERNI